MPFVSEVWKHPWNTNTEEFYEWFFDFDKLDVALHRGWIFQESAFGALDKQGVTQLLSEVRWAGEALVMSGTDDDDECIFQFIKQAT